MQYNHIFTVKKADKSLLHWLVKMGVFILVALYIWYVIENKDQFNSQFQSALFESYLNFHFWWVIPVLLFFVNWSLEALKWQYLLEKIEKVSFIKSFSGILTGVAIGMATPLGIGDYAGRIFQLNHPERAKAVGAVFISRISQFYITLIWGSFAMVYFYSQILDSDSILNYLLLFFVGIAHLFLISLLLFHKRILARFNELVIMKKIYPYIEIISQYSLRELLHIICISMFRYFIFTMQFVMILYFFKISERIDLLLIGVTFIFLVKSVVPTFFDLGVRESAAVFFFTTAGCASNKIIFASLSLWAINILLPALLGLFMIFRIKIFANK